MISGFITINKLFGLYPLASEREVRLTFPVCGGRWSWQNYFFYFVDIGDSLILQYFHFSLLLSFLLPPLLVLPEKSSSRGIKKRS